jgi:hypothetical protein
MPTRPGVPVFTGVQVRTVAGFDAGGSVARHGVISLSWTAADHATNYQVYARSGQEPEIPLIPNDRPLTALNFDHDPVEYETVYQYRVEAFNDGVPSGMSDPPTPPVRASVPLPLQNGADYYYVVWSANPNPEPENVPVELARSAEVSAAPRENIVLTPPTAVAVSDTPHDLGGSLTITWTPSTTRGVAKQRLSRSSTGDQGSYVSLQTFNDNTTSAFVDSNLTDGNRYFYALSALAGDLESDLSPSASGVPLSDGPETPPTGLSVSDRPDDAGGALLITWVPSTAFGVTAERLYRTTTAGELGDRIMEWIDLNDLSLGKFIDEKVSTGQTYYYKVAALIGGQDVPSDQASGVAEVNLEPFPPRSLQATDSPVDFGGAIDLSWSPSVSSLATEQRLYRATSSGGPYQLVAVFNDTSSSNYTDFGVPSAPSATGLVVVPEGSDLLVTWSPVADAADGYRLYWWEKDDSGVIQSSGTKVDIVTERFVHPESELNSGSHYVYAVQVRGFPAVSFPVEATAP